VLAEAYGKNGQIEEGLATLAEALAFVQKSGECMWKAEIYRIKGELLLQKSEEILNSGSWLLDSSPEACFHKALEVARRQQAKSLELRAVVSLSRLWQKQGKLALSKVKGKEEARQMLAEIAGWFTEGFDTADLKDARALLEELS
jgi:predicted ATPase